MTAYFITATGTDIGKTFVTSLLIRYFRNERLPVHVCKPVMSGVADLHATDAGVLLRALGREVDEHQVAAFSPWRFAAPLSPHRASALEGATLDLDILTRWCRDWLAQFSSSVRLIEGVGGVMVPLNDSATTLDWMRRLGLPVLLVTGDYLGTFSHTLSALACLQEAGVKVRGIIVNQSAESVEHDQAVRTLRSFTEHRIPVVPLPRMAEVPESDDAFKLLRHHPGFQDFFSFARGLWYSDTHGQ